MLQHRQPATWNSELGMAAPPRPAPGQAWRVSVTLAARSGCCDCGEEPAPRRLQSLSSCQNSWNKLCGLQIMDTEASRKKFCYTLVYIFLCVISVWPE